MNKSGKGFTLIELLVVIAIIALLLAIIMPALKVAKLQAQGAVCLANIKGLSQAWTAYAVDNDDKIPGSFTDQHPFWDTSINLNENWVYSPQTDAGVELNWSSAPSSIEEKINGIRKGVLFAYTDTEKVYHCPADKRSLKPAPPIVNGVAIPSGMIGAYRTYSMVDALNNPRDSISPNLISHKKVTTITSPGQKYVFLEERDMRGYNINSWVLFAKSGSKWGDPIGIFHNDRGNLGFADGHAEKHIWKDPDTIKAAEQGRSFLDDPGSVDLAYMQRGYPWPK